MAQTPVDVETCALRRHFRASYSPPQQPARRGGKADVAGCATDILQVRVGVAWK